MSPTEIAGEFRRGFAGDTFNTTWYLRALRPEIQTRYITHVGNDDASNSMLGMMDDAGINTSYIGKSDTRTVGLYLISLNNGERSFSYWRGTSAARELGQNPTAIDHAIKDVDLIYFSGISLAILDETGRANLLNSLKRARANGKTIAFDSNLRPRLWANTTQMTQAIMDAAAVSDIVLPSYDDEVTFFDDANIDSTAARYLNAGAKTIVVKNGSGSVYFAHDSACGYVSTDAAGHVIDTTSAGDSFNAGFFAGVDRHMPIQTLIKNASQVARQVIGRKGALVPLDLTEIEGLK